MNRDTPFAAFSAANDARRPCFQNKKGDWTPNDWMTALCGEVGELANMVKKLRRGLIIRGKALPTKANLVREVADVFTYLDLLAQELDIDTSEAISGIPGDTFARRTARRIPYNYRKDYSPCDWMTSLCGCVGQLASMLDRDRIGRGQLDKGQAETAIYTIYDRLERLCASLDIDAGDAITSGFDAVSREVGHV